MRFRDCQGVTWKQRSDLGAEGERREGLERESVREEMVLEEREWEMIQFPEGELGRGEDGEGASEGVKGLGRELQIKSHGFEARAGEDLGGIEDGG